jgi:hypothetical protein
MKYNVYIEIQKYIFIYLNTLIILYIFEYILYILIYKYIFIYSNTNIINTFYVFKYKIYFI